MASIKSTQWRPSAHNQVLASKLLKEGSITELLAKLLAQRKVSTAAEVKIFLSPDLNDLHDPFLMKGMEKAVSRLAAAIDSKEKILLYGDYDVDGTTSIALLSEFLKKCNTQPTYYVPDRYKEGYGISLEGIEYAHRHGFTLMIAMDCGIKAFNPANLAKNYGIDLIICDHHRPEKTLPNAYAILDPLQAQCEYPFKFLSGCGVTFKFVQAYCQRQNLSEQHWMELLDLLVISIAADIVPLIGENRILAHFGLKLLDKTKRPGLAALIKHSQKEVPLSISDIVFGIAPLINAAGRMAEATLSVSLLLATNAKDATELTNQLAYQNKLRKEFEHRITEEARQLYEKQKERGDTHSIVLFQPHWHKGVVGIVASKLVETFHKPTIILTESEGIIVGSARSVRGFDIHEAIGHCSFSLVNYGGHEYAAGLSLFQHNLNAFQDCFEGYVAAHITDEQKTPLIEYNSEINFSAINDSLFEILEILAPFGPSNRNPIFVTRGVVDTGDSRLLKEKHLKLIMKQEGDLPVKGMAFFINKEVSNRILSGEIFDICYTLSQNKWRGRSNWQLVVKDIKLVVHQM